MEVARKLAASAILAVCALTPSMALAQCFDKQTVAAQIVSADEKSFTFQKKMHLCDGSGNTSADISNVTVLLLITQNEVLTQDKMTLASSVYMEVNYDFYSGTGTWAGSQPVILTIQDANHNDLTPRPVFDENTPRQGCRYGKAVPYKTAEKFDPNVYNQVAFMTLQIPRVSGTQHPC